MRPAFESTYLVLLAELWNELDGIADSLSGGVVPRAQVCTRAQAFLIELDLLDTAVIVWWHSQLLTGSERDRVGRLVAELRNLLDFPPLELPRVTATAALMRAQNRLYDEVCALCPSVSEGLRASA
jgi:hypothetical protein